MIEKDVEIEANKILNSFVLEKDFDIVFYCEDREDSIFWTRVLKECNFNKRFRFEYETERTDLNKESSKGKTVALKYLPFCCNKLKLCLDSDYDFVLDKPNFNIENHILQTYVYAIENYKCFAPSLNPLYIDSIKLPNTIFDFERFLKDYSNIIFDLFVISVISEKSTKFYPIVKKFCEEDIQLDFTKNLSESLNDLKTSIKNVINSLSQKYTSKEFDATKNEIAAKGINSDNCYLFIQGHFLFDDLVLRLLHKCLKIESNEHLEKLIEEKEKTDYKKKLYETRLEQLLNEKFNFYDCTFFQNIRSDVNYLNTILA